jgi:hypothetical protein
MSYLNLLVKREELLKDKSKNFDKKIDMEILLIFVGQLCFKDQDKKMK